MSSPAPHPDEMPRERLLKHGAKALATHELLAILLRTGIKGEGVMDFSKNLLTKHGGLRGLARLSAKDLIRIKGFGEAKGTQIAAALELANRLMQESSNDIALDSPERIYERVAAEMTLLKRESLRILLCNNRLHLLCIEEISRGTSTQTFAHIPDILRPVIVQEAHGFVLVHNHPSGDPEPSRADIDMTRRLKDASDLLGVRFIDHLVIGTPSPNRPKAFFSFKESGRL